MKKAIITILLSSTICFLMGVSVFAEEQETPAIPEESMQEMISAEKENSSEQEEVSGKETLVSEEDGEEGTGAQTVPGDQPAAESQEKQEDTDTIVAEAGAEKTDGEETPVAGTDGAGAPVEEEKAEVPASGEQEQADPSLCVSDDTEEITEQKEASVRKTVVRKMAASPAASSNTTGSQGTSTTTGTTSTTAGITSTAAGTTSTTGGTKSATVDTKSAAAGTTDTEGTGAAAGSSGTSQGTTVAAEGPGVQSGFTGVVRDSEDGPWYYYRNGKRDTAYAGFAQDGDRNWYYVEAGEVNRGYTGVAYREKNATWYYFRNGELDWGYTGIAKDHPADKSKTKWYRVEGGEVNLAFEGLAKRPENKTWYFLRDGILDWNYTGVGVNPTSKHMYRVNYGEVDFNFKGLAKRPEDKTWYFLSKGEVDKSYTGIGQNPKSKYWYRVKDGIVDFSFKGVAKRPENGIWYYMKNGELDWGYTGIAKDPSDQSWYRVEKGEVNWNYTGGALRPENNTWYYIKDGKLDWTYSGQDTGKDGKTRIYQKGCMIGSSEKTDAGLLYKAPVSNGKIVALDPGHSYVIPAGGEPLGPGSGAMKEKDTYGTIGWATGLKEADLNLAVATKLRMELLKRGYSVILTREDNDTAVSCVDRTNVANTIGADAYIRLHGNGDTSCKSGALMMCITAANTWQSAHFEDCNRLSQNVLDEYCAATGFNRIGVWNVDTLTGNNWAEVPTTLIEMGNMCNGSDDRWMADEANQETMAIGIANGLDVFFDLRKEEGKEQASK